MKNNKKNLLEDIPINRIKNTDNLVISNRIHGWSEYVVTLLALVVTILVWWVLTESRLSIVKIIPGPLSVVNSSIPIGSTIHRHMLATILRIIAGYLSGSLVGIFIGLMLCYFKKLFILSNGIIESMRPIPPVALIPFFLLVFGFSEFGRLLMVGLGVAVIFIVSTMEAARETPPRYIEAIITLGAKKRSIYYHIVMPYVLSRLLGPARVALALSISLVIVSEFMGVQYGLGYLINISKVTFALPTILLSTVLLGVISGIFDSLLRFIFYALTPWVARFDKGLDTAYSNNKGN